VLADPHRQCVQRIVLTASGTESVAEAKEVFLPDGARHFHQRAPDHLVLQRRDAQGPLASIGLGM
jgi:hypothetical protein